jgi:hypothetical protein
MSDGVADAYLAGDITAIKGRLAPDAVFRSPITDYHGEDEIMPVLVALGDVLEGMRAISKLEGAGESAVLYAGRVGTKEVHGILHVETALDGRISCITMMVRPLDALLEGVRLMDQKLSR